MADDLVIRLDDSKVRLAVEDAILRTIDPETQQTLIREALAHLSKPYDRSSYGGPGTPKSPLAAAFQRQVEMVVDTTARELLAPGTPLRESLDAMIGEQLQKWITEKDDVFLLALGQGIASALKGRTDDGY